MRKYLYRIHDVEGSALNIQYTIFSQKCVFPLETEVENLEFLKISGYFQIPWPKITAFGKWKTEIAIV